jgi:AcrR family transcriptional regulator
MAKRAKTAKRIARGGDWKRGKDETRRELVEAAKELFAQNGYRGTSVRALAASAKVTTGAFYSNFRSKREIYIAVLDEIASTIHNIVDGMAREIIETMKKRSGAQMEYELLRRPIVTLLDAAARHASLLQILRREGLGRDPDFKLEIDRVWERLVEAVRRALDMYIQAGFAKPYETELVARATVPMFLAMSLYDVASRGKHRQEVVSLLASMFHGGASQWVAWRELEGNRTG